MKMTPTERATDLVNKFGKEIAPKVVDEIINALETYDDYNDTFELQNMDGDFRYWDKVNYELTKPQELDTIEQAFDTIEQAREFIDTIEQVKEFVNSLNNKQTFKQQEQ